MNKLFATNNSELKPTRLEAELLRRYLHWEKLQRVKEQALLTDYHKLDRVAIWNLKQEISSIDKEKRRVARAFRSVACRDIEEYLK